MEKADRELLEEISSSITHVRALATKHRKLEKEIERYGRYAAYSSSAALKQKELKREKLRDMDLIMSIINEHKSMTMS